MQIILVRNLGFLKNRPLPLAHKWLVAVVSAFSLRRRKNLKNLWRPP
jgi:hypothetical protein